jgi:6-phosphogluconolactonase (cycloisomerase 2 family)
MRLHYLRFTLIGPVLLLLLMLMAGTAGATSVSQPAFNLNSAGTSAHHSIYTSRHVTVTPLDMQGSGTHYLYVDDGVCPDAIDAYKTGTSLTHVGNYPIGACNSYSAFGSSIIAVAMKNSSHGPCLLYGGESSSQVGLMASYPINANGSLGSEVNQVNTTSGADPTDVVVTPNGKFAYETSKGVDIESFGIGAGCKLTQLHSVSASNQYSLSLALLGTDLVTTDLNTSNIYTYTLGSDGSITLKATVTGQITAPDSIAFQTYKKHHKTHYRIFTGEAVSGAPAVQDGAFNKATGKITFLKNSPASDPSGNDGAAVIFDPTHSFLIQAEQFTNTLANYSTNASGVKFVSETSLGTAGQYPTTLDRLGTTLFVDIQLGGDVQACSLTASGATGCVTVATLTHSGVSSGMTLY